MVTPPSRKALSLAPSCGFQRRDQHFSWLTGEVEWLGQMSDALLTQSVIDRLKAAATRSCWEASLTANMKPGRPVRTAAPRPRRRY